MGINKGSRAIEPFKQTAKRYENYTGDTWHKPHYGMEDLLAIMRMLRSENGCPWDKEQTHESIRKNFLEETCEVLEAIDLKDQDLLKEELGDVLLQVVFHSDIERERGSFNFDDVVTDICPQADRPPSPCVRRCPGEHHRSGAAELGRDQTQNQRRCLG